MAVPVFRAAAHAVAQISDNVVIPKPTGTVQNDVMIAAIYFEPASQEITTVPQDWATFARLENTGFGLELFWKRAGASEGTNYTFGQSGNSWGGGSIDSFSGCITTGSPLDVVGADNTGSSAVAKALSVTTLTNDTLLLYIAGLFVDSNTITVPSGMTERHNVTTERNQYLATLDLPSAGATGDKDGTVSSSDQWVAVLVALSSGAAAGSPSASVSPSASESPSVSPSASVSPSPSPSAGAVQIVNRTVLDYYE